ncbi:hypothetical protein P22_2882 [Propionispora sp. 2/2-37]|uniref:hypothetical protein n=1 Tax=Propionispora sp. 2/2-37 TaxID=1677858 RepID=UPI0006BB8DB6|nr:hypothetical protein [Propionispora sp. 2/2-37]CUH96771.1 hypothetical protein P22_2882 [Propionispora sp. 2/2-37]
MLGVNDFIKNVEESDDRYICYNLGKDIRIFNYVIEDEELSNIEIYISSNVHLGSIINEIIRYIAWFNQCETELRTYYENELHEKVYDTWFDDIEVYNARFTFNSADDYGATISCGDQIIPDHTLEIDFEKEEVADIRLNG